MINSITVLHNNYNADSESLTTLWSSADTGSFHISRDDYPQFPLESGVLVPGLKLEFNKSVNLYALVGLNGAGKTTFLHAIDASISRAKYFSANGRTAMFSGNIGLNNGYNPNRERIRTATGGLDVQLSQSGYHENSGNNYHALSLFTHGASREETSRLDNHFNAFAFYLVRHELYNGDSFKPYRQISDEQLMSRVTLLFNPTYKRLDKAKLPHVLNQKIKQLAVGSGLEDLTLYRRLAYLIENHDLVAQMDFPINVFGDLQLKFNRKPISDVSVGIFDPKLQKEGDDRSAGEYAKQTLQTLLEQEPTVFLIDEPMKSCDRKNKSWILDTFLPALRERQGSTIAFIASHEDSLIKKVDALGGLALNMYSQPAEVEKVDFEAWDSLIQ